MKKIFALFAFMALALCSTTLFAEQVTFDLTSMDQVRAADNDSVVWMQGYDARMALYKGASQTNANNYLPNGSYTHSRFYKSQELYFSVYGTNARITSVVFTSAGTSYNPQFANLGANTYSTSGTETTIHLATPASTLNLHPNNTARLRSVTIYYEQDQTGSSTDTTSTSTGTINVDRENYDFGSVTADDVINYQWKVTRDFGVNYFNLPNPVVTTAHNYVTVTVVPDATQACSLRVVCNQTTPGSYQDVVYITCGTQSKTITITYTVTGSSSQPQDTTSSSTGTINVDRETYDFGSVTADDVTNYQWKVTRDFGVHYGELPAPTVTTAHNYVTVSVVPDTYQSCSVRVVCNKTTPGSYQDIVYITCGSKQKTITVTYTVSGTSTQPQDTTSQSQNGQIDVDREFFDFGTVTADDVTNYQWKVTRDFGVHYGELPAPTVTTAHNYVTVSVVPDTYQSCSVRVVCNKTTPGSYQDIVYITCGSKQKTITVTYTVSGTSTQPQDTTSQQTAQIEMDYDRYDFGSFTSDDVTNTTWKVTQNFAVQYFNLPEPTITSQNNYVTLTVIPDVYQACSLRVVCNQATPGTYEDVIYITCGTQSKRFPITYTVTGSSSQPQDTTSTVTLSVDPETWNFGLIKAEDVTNFQWRVTKYFGVHYGELPEPTITTEHDYVSVFVVPAANQTCTLRVVCNQTTPGAYQDVIYVTSGTQTKNITISYTVEGTTPEPEPEPFTVKVLLKVPNCGDDAIAPAIHKQDDTTAINMRLLSNGWYSAEFEATTYGWCRIEEQGNAENILQQVDSMGRKHNVTVYYYEETTLIRQDLSEEAVWSDCQIVAGDNNYVKDLTLNFAQPIPGGTPAANATVTSSNTSLTGTAALTWHDQANPSAAVATFLHGHTYYATVDLDAIVAAPLYYNSGLKITWKAGSVINTTTAAQSVNYKMEDVIFTVSLADAVLQPNGTCTLSASAVCNATVETYEFMWYLSLNGIDFSGILPAAGFTINPGAWSSSVSFPATLLPAGTYYVKVGLNCTVGGTPKTFESNTAKVVIAAGAAVEPEKISSGTVDYDAESAVLTVEDVTTSTTTETAIAITEKGATVEVKGTSSISATETGIDTSADITITVAETDDSGTTEVTISAPRPIFTAAEDVVLTFGPVKIVLSCSAPAAAPGRVASVVELEEHAAYMAPRRAIEARHAAQEGDTYSVISGFADVVFDGSAFEEVGVYYSPTRKEVLDGAGNKVTTATISPRSVPTDVENLIEYQTPNVEKFMRNGVLYLQLGTRIYDSTGRLVEQF